MKRLFAALAIALMATAANAETITRQALAQALKNLTGATGIGGATITFTTGGTDRWTINASGDFNPVTDNSYSIGNGLTNPKDINLSRYLSLYSGATHTTNGLLNLNATGDLTWSANTLTSSAPTAALAGVAGSVDNGTHVYAETCVTAGGETNASASSGVVTVADKTVNGQVTVTLATATACGPFTTGRNLYRSKAGTATPLYLVAASPVVADNTTATYTDNIADAALQATTAPTTNTALDLRRTDFNTGNVTFRGLFVTHEPYYATASTGNAVTLSQRLLTTVQTRPAFIITTSFSNTTDATRNTLTIFQTANAGTFANAIVINGGNVGIGTSTTPTGPLAISAFAPTVGTLTATNSAEVRTVVNRYDWTNTMVTALGGVTAGDLTVCTLPAKTIVKRALIVIDTPDTSANALTVALGITGATYLDYVVASDAKAAANTVYGDAKAEIGAKLYDGTTTIDNLPSYTATTAVKLHFIKTTSNLSTVLGSTGHVYLETEVLP